nr:uncharacterized protein LOC127336019 [Lolium perenne]
MDHLIRKRQCPLLLLLLFVFLSAILKGVPAVYAGAYGQGIGADQLNMLMATVKKGGGGHGGHGGHGRGHGNGGSERGRGMPETPPVFNPRTVAGNGNQHHGRSAAATDLSRSSTCVLLAVAVAFTLLHL